MESSLDSPVFLFSAGWRTGSTLLQRMLTASNEILIWGEPGGSLDCFADAAERYVQMLGSWKRRFEHGRGGSGAQAFEQFSNTTPNKRHQVWIGCMAPPIEVIYAGFQGMMNSIYRQAAADLGYQRWGIKEVRSGIKIANFLRKLYPEAKFVFLVRNPFDCLLSIKRHKWMDFQEKRGTIVYFARHWYKLAKEFREADFGLLVRYEDLVSTPETVKKVFNYVGVSKIPPDFIQESFVDWRTSSHQARLSWAEYLRARLILTGEMARHGYTRR